MFRDRKVNKAVLCDLLKDVTCLSGAQCYFSLKLTCPMNGTSTESINVSRPGKDILSKGRVFLMPHSCKICIHIHVESEGLGGFENEPFVLGEEEIPCNTFDC
jgi:hypothetical protein